MDKFRSFKRQLRGGKKKVTVIEDDDDDENEELVSFADEEKIKSVNDLS